MNYDVGAIVSLYDGRTVHIMMKNETMRTYSAYDMDDTNSEYFDITDEDIFIFLTST